jgi:hypothetical protein
MNSKDQNSKDVITSDGKNIGKVYSTDEDEEDHLIVYKKGLLTDQKFRIPVSAIVVEESSAHLENSIRLDLTEEQLKHGYQFLKSEPNSEFMHGKRESEPKVRLKKQIIQFEPATKADADNALTTGSNPIPIQEGQGYSIPRGYRCDMCTGSFEEVNQLEKHRSEIHHTSANI